MKSIRKILFVLLICFVFLTACTNNKVDSKVIGTWVNSSEGYEASYTFNGDGTGVSTLTAGDDASTQKFTFETKDSKILIKYNDDSDNSVFEWKYKFDGKDLVMIDTFGTEIVMKKSKKNK